MESYGLFQAAYIQLCIHIKAWVCVHRLYNIAAIEVHWNQNCNKLVKLPKQKLYNKNLAANL